MGISESHKTDINIAPNPSSAQIKIQSNEEISQINIYSMQGNIVYAEQLNSKESSISISELNKGLYIVQIKLLNGKTVNKKIIKQ
jgi:hypothetical protein